MIITNNLFVMLFALIPIFVYVFMFYNMIPEKMVSLDRGRRYLISGLMSPFLVFLIYFVFPNWGIEISDNEFLNYIFYSIIQIGLLEELSKFTVFQWVSKERLSSKNDLPVATIFYSYMIALGFALTENISYLISLYENNSIIPFMTDSELDASLIKLATIRSMTAVIMHMICGIILGYFIVLAKETRKMSKNELNNNYLKTILKNNKYIFYGIISAALYHGIYDLNLLLPENNYNLMFTSIILFFGLIISVFMIKEMIALSRQKRLSKIY